MVATLAVLSVAGLLVLGLSWPLTPDEKLWGSSLIASDDEGWGWIRIGERPVGFVAIGGQPTGVFALGWLPIGVFSMGIYPVGVFSVGLLALGLVSSGVGSAGWLSFGTWGSIGWYSYSADGTSIGVRSWGRRAYGYYFASSPERIAARQPDVLMKETTNIPDDAPQRGIRVLAGAAARHCSRNLVGWTAVITGCGVAGLLIALGVLDPFAPNGGVLSWQELVADRDERWQWISVGDRPAGVVAIGQQPTGLIAIGLFPVGVISIGVVSAGVISVGLGAIGLGSLGLLAIGWLSFGNGSVGWYAYARDGTALGAYSWGWRAYGIFGAHRGIRVARPPPSEKLLFREVR